MKGAGDRSTSKKWVSGGKKKTTGKKKERRKLRIWDAERGEDRSFCLQKKKKAPVRGEEEEIKVALELEEAHKKRRV